MRKTSRVKIRCSETAANSGSIKETETGACHQWRISGSSRKQHLAKYCSSKRGGISGVKRGANIEKASLAAAAASTSPGYRQRSASPYGAAEEKCLKRGCGRRGKRISMMAKRADGNI